AGRREVGVSRRKGGGRRDRGRGVDPRVRGGTRRAGGGRWPHRGGRAARQWRRRAQGLPRPPRRRPGSAALRACRTTVAHRRRTRQRLLAARRRADRGGAASNPRGALTAFRSVEAALRLADVADLADRPVEALSGGQRQRVWIAMTLAQDTEVLLLDEPTTYLDLAHQIEVLDLLRRLQGDGRPVVAVLHALNQAARYADHVIAMRDGAVVATGPPAEILTSTLVRDVFGLDCVVVPCPVSGAPLIVPGATQPQPVTDGGVINA